jgi:hypothetical protein
MNIKSIQAIQVPQNAVRPADGNDATSEGRSVSSAGKAGSGVPSIGSRTPQIQSSGTGASVDNVQLLLHDLITVHYPPFFPLGKYQRIELIKKVRVVQEEVDKSDIDSNLKKTHSGEKLTDNATDKEISTALEKLFELRNKITGRKPAPTGKTKPGMILNAKV